MVPGLIRHRPRGLFATDAWVASDVRRNRNIIKMGILGKTLVFVLIIPAWLRGEVTALSAAAAMVDLVFTVLFVDVLTKNPT